MRTSTRGIGLACAILLAGALLLFNTVLTPAKDEVVTRAVRGSVSDAKAQVESVSVDDLAELMAAGEAVNVLDVRTEAAYAAGHLRGAVWVPCGKLEFEPLKGKLGSPSDS